IRYCEKNQITFTRSRAYRINDSCYVEQKNWSVVRKAVGYLRYDREEQLELLNQLYEILRLYNNYFQPVLKLTKKERQGAKVKKTYDLAQTPYQRVQASPEISEEQKLLLKEKYAMLNPVTLKRNICLLQEKLFHSSLTNTTSLPEQQRSVLNYEYISF
ncbi:MAG: ISNCY family transposase, partial [Bacillota bacterium]|nr:ISNCY family transposase [Bacillota bacterium]